MGEKGLSSATRAALARLNRRACSQATHCIAVYNWEGRGGGRAATKGEGVFLSLSSLPAPSPIVFFFVLVSAFARLNFLLYELQKEKHTKKPPATQAILCQVKFAVFSIGMRFTEISRSSGRTLGLRRCKLFLCFAPALSFPWFYCVDSFVSFVLRHSWVLQVLKPRANGCNIVG